MKRGARLPAVLRRVNPKAMGAAAGGQFPEEDNFVPYFLIGDMIVADPGHLEFQLIEFMIVCGEEGLWRKQGVVQIFGDAPGYRDAVICACSAADFIEEDQ